MRRPFNKRPISALLATIGGIVTTVLIGPSNARAADVPAPPTPFGEIQVKRTENWIQAQIRKFRTFPHLDRAYRLMQRDRLPEAKAELDHYLEIDPRDLQVRMTYVTVLYRSQRYWDAIHHTDIVLREQPGTSSALLYRGLARQALGQVTEAQADLLGVADDPRASREDRLFAASTVADTALKREKHDEALAALDRVAAISADYNLQYRRGMALEALARLDEADAAYRSALKRASDTSERLRVLNAIGNLAKKRDDWEGARAHFTAALELDPVSSELMRALAVSAYAMKDYESAVEWTRKVLAFRSTPRDREFLANLLLERKDYRGAVEEYAGLLNEPTAADQRYRLLMSLGYANVGLAQHLAAAAYFRRAADINRDPAALAALAQALEQGGRPADAIRPLQALVKLQPSAETHLRLANLHAKLDDETSVIRHLEQATQAAGLQEAHLRLGTLYAKRGGHAKAIHHLSQATRGKLSADERKSVYQQLGHLHARLGQHDAAAEAFGRAIGAGLDGWLIRQDLGFALLKANRANEALENFKLAHQQRPTALSAVYLGRCHRMINRSEEARHYLNLALSSQDQVEMPLRKELYDELGYLHAEDGDNANAADAWSRSLALQKDPAIALRLARVQRLLGDTDAAEQTLESVASAELPTELQVARADELGQVYGEKRQIDKAIAALNEANALQPVAEREHRIGFHHLDLNRPTEAIPHFEAAVVREPSTSHYAESLAYAYRRAGRLSDAARVFEAVAEREPDRVGVQQDLAYTYMQNGDNDKAERWFKRAIDRRSLMAVSSWYDQEALDQDVYRMRQEVNKLTHRYDFTFYQAYRSRTDGARGGSGASGSGVIPSQGGMEFLYQPPGIGFRDERIFQVFTRLLWTSQPQSLSLDRDTLQAGIGARYKPLKNHNLFFSAERLVKVGSQAEGDWLLRSSYGWSAGYDLKPGERFWNHTLFYGDVGYFANRGGTWAYFAELRQGMTFNAQDRLLVTPHLSVNGRQQRPDPFSGSYVEAGAGVSLRYLFNGSRHEPPRSSLELLLQYKRGISPGNDGGWALTAFMRF